MMELCALAKKRKARDFQQGRSNASFLMESQPGERE
jgi:hypothetical protein